MSRSNPDAVWDIMKGILGVLVIVALLFAYCTAYDNDYDECMREKKDKYTCETYVRVKYRVSNSD